MSHAFKMDTFRRDALKEEVLIHWQKGIEASLEVQKITSGDFYLIDQFSQILQEVLSSELESKKTFLKSSHFFEAKLQKFLIGFHELRKSLGAILEKEQAKETKEKHAIFSNLDKKMDEVILSIFSEFRMLYQSETVAAQSDAERFKFAAAAGRTYFWEWENITGLMWRSEGFDELHGIRNTHQNLTLEDFYSSIHQEDREFVKKTIQAVQDDRGNWIQLNYRVNDLENKTRFIRANGYLYRDGHGRLIRMAGVVTEIK